MKFEEALKAMREGKKIFIPGTNYRLSCISKIYYNNDENRPVEAIPTEYILSEDWKIIE
jgi:hypothetical protein